MWYERWARRMFNLGNSAEVEMVREALDDRAIAYELHVVEDVEGAIDFIERIDRDSTLLCPKRFFLLGPSPS
jgi:hypothetical protein